MYIEFHPYTLMIHICIEKFILMDIVHVFKFCFYQNLFWFLLSKTSIYHLLCVLDSIHIHNALNVFQYLIFVFIQVYRKIRFSFQCLDFQKYSFWFFAYISLSQK